MERLLTIPNVHLEGLWFPRFEFERPEVQPDRLVAPEMEFEVEVLPGEGDKYAARISVKSDPDKQASFHLSVVARLEFALGRENADLPDETMKRFLRVNSLVLAWPYLREMISSAAGRMGFPPLFLAMLDVSQIYSAFLTPEERERSEETEVVRQAE